MNLAWTFGNFVSQKLHRPDLASVSYHWAVGEQQGRLSQSAGVWLGVPEEILKLEDKPGPPH
jgi:hypothetical protein